MDLANFAVRFSRLWVELCRDLPIGNQLSRSSGLAVLYEQGHISEVTTYLLDLSDDQQASVDGLVETAMALNRHVAQLKWTL